MNPRLLTPVVSAGAAWATRKGLNAAYASRHEGMVPTRDDTRAPFRQVIFWSIVTAVIIAVVDVLVQQGMSRLADRQELRSSES